MVSDGDQHGENVAPVTTEGFKGFVIMLSQGSSGSVKGRHIQPRWESAQSVVSPEALKEGGLLMTDLQCMLGPRR